MNIVFVALMLISLIIVTISSPASVFSVMIGGVNSGIMLCIKLLAIYSVWLSILKMAEALGLDKKLSIAMRPIVKRLFKDESDEAYNWICINLSANMLGMGGVATPAGIKAIAKMQCDEERASDNMIMLLAINATSIQLVPATIIAIRSSAGSNNGADIFFPTLISSGIATICAMILCKVFALKDKPNKKSYNNDKNILSYRFAKIKPAFCKINKKKNGRNPQ